MRIAAYDDQGARRHGVVIDDQIAPLPPDTDLFALLEEAPDQDWVLAGAGHPVPLSQVILFESFLSFLGLGVQEPFASLGSLINEGAQEMESSPWMLLVPATLLMLVLGAFNVLGDALRARLNSVDE